MWTFFCLLMLSPSVKGHIRYFRFRLVKHTVLSIRRCQWPGKLLHTVHLHLTFSYFYVCSAIQYLLFTSHYWCCKQCCTSASQYSIVQVPVLVRKQWCTLPSQDADACSVWLFVYSIRWKIACCANIRKIVNTAPSIMRFRGNIFLCEQHRYISAWRIVALTVYYWCIIHKRKCLFFMA
jgi:hypothetical protein